MVLIVGEWHQRDQPTGAGANMSPGSQIRALTATSARANNTTISAGKRVERKKLHVSIALATIVKPAAPASLLSWIENEGHRSAAGVTRRAPPPPTKPTDPRLMRREGTRSQQTPEQHRTAEQKATDQFIEWIHHLNPEALTPTTPTRTRRLHLTHKRLDHSFRFRRRDQHDHNPNHGRDARGDHQTHAPVRNHQQRTTEVQRPTTKPQTMAASSAAALMRHQNQRNTSMGEVAGITRRNTEPMLTINARDHPHQQENTGEHRPAARSPLGAQKALIQVMGEVTGSQSLCSAAPPAAASADPTTQSQLRIRSQFSNTKANTRPTASCERACCSSRVASIR